MQSAFDQQAYTMFRQAHNDRPTAEEVKLLAADLRGIAKDELDGDDPTSFASPADELALDAAGILRQRIGGLTALQGYVNCLKAGAKRRA